MDKLRLDKWLWAARFFKTRSLASDAIDAGHVQVNGHRAKPAKEIRVGDRLDIVHGDSRWEVVVRALSERRGPAPEARLLYEETPESLSRREAEREARRYAAEPASERQGRPTKRDRRRLDRFG